jgi:hypothetical protein
VIYLVCTLAGVLLGVVLARGYRSWEVLALRYTARKWQGLYQGERTERRRLTGALHGNDNLLAELAVPESLGSVLRNMEEAR